MKMSRCWWPNCCVRTASRCSPPWTLTISAIPIWTLLTHNRIDYERLQAEGLRDQRPHAGILIANRRASDFDLARRIMTVLDRFTPKEIANHLLYL